MTDFVKNGVLTAEGKEVVALMDEAMKPALEDPNPTKLNALPGPVKHFQANVRSLRAMSEAEWLSSYSTAAESLYERIQDAKQKAEAAAKASAATEGVSGLTQQLADLKKLVEAQAVQIAELSKKPAKKKPESEDEA